MRPLLAICQTPSMSGDDALALALESPLPCVEVTVDPDEVQASIASAAGLSTLAGRRVAVRYHFPLGPWELSGPCPDVANRTLARMRETVHAIAESRGDYLTIHAALPSEAAGTQRHLDTIARLKDLVEVGHDRGVTVALENLRWGLTSQPDEFLHLIAQSGAMATIDIGHAVSSDAALRGYSAEHLVADLGQRVLGAHVYDRETDRHHAPVDLERIGLGLNALCDAGCPWWTIELSDPVEVRSTRELLTAFLDARYHLGDPSSGANT